MIGALQRCSNSEDHVMNTQCREGSKTSAAVYAPLEGDIESVPVSEASHPSIMISGRPPAVESTFCCSDAWLIPLAVSSAYSAISFFSLLSSLN
jgi:hypothetical protein